MSEVREVYCDGGVIDRNPSAQGGTWAWVHVGPGEVELARNCGIIRPTVMTPRLITNNFTELLAAVYALRALPEGWSGTLYTDSQVTLFRLTRADSKFNGIPEWLEQLTREVVSRCSKLEVTLLDGHPTQNQLYDGKGKRGNPVSRWNVLCDKLCSEQAALFKQSKSSPLLAGEIDGSGI